jgi:hypothetical protein
MQKIIVKKPDLKVTASALSKKTFVTPGQMYRPE